MRSDAKAVAPAARREWSVDPKTQDVRNVNEWPRDYMLYRGHIDTVTTPTCTVHSRDKEDYCGLPAIYVGRGRYESWMMYCEVHAERLRKVAPWVFGDSAAPAADTQQGEALTD